MSIKYIAHVRRNTDGSWAEPHGLANHSEGTASRAESFASKFQSQQWAKAAGWGHDAGKGRPEWLAYLILKSGYDLEAHLEGKTGKVLHAIHGAELVERIYGKGIGACLPIALPVIIQDCRIGPASKGPDKLRYNLENRKLTKWILNKLIPR